MPSGVYKRTKEHCAALRIPHKYPKGVVKRKGQVPWNKGLTAQTDSRVAKYSGENNGAKQPVARKKIGNSSKQFYATPEGQKILSNNSKKLWQDPDYRERQLEVRHSKEFRQQRRIETKRTWQDPVYVAKQMKASRASPNKPEQFLIKLFELLCPGEWKYAGNGGFPIGRCKPDFININGQMKAIEFFGDYHHGPEVTGQSNENEEQQKIEHHTQYGYQTLVIWERELNNIEALCKRIITFTFSLEEQRAA